jgi:glycosyltransferase involved in cell wall biosynthesis
MKRLHYISPSELPSRSANAIHVINQCNAIANMGIEVFLYAKRTLKNEDDLANEIFRIYGIKSSNLKFLTYFSLSKNAVSLRIALIAIKKCIFSHKDYILARNLYAAFILAIVFRRRILFETHQLEYGFKRIIQRFLISCPVVKTILISNKLLEILSTYHNIKINNYLVLHDAAPSETSPVDEFERRKLLCGELNEDIISWRKVCGYFGHLYEGRGIEIIIDMATLVPECLFLVYGGNESDVLFYKKSVKLNNLRFMGYITHVKTQQIMRLHDVLLMPYQHEVSIGIDFHDTARWMSPMKMFEYMASGVTVISSDLPVLREILQDGFNALLVEPNDPNAWTSALLSLIHDSELPRRLALQARSDFIKHHTWLIRANKIIAAAEEQ